jgi:hypothetical protein
LKISGLSPRTVSLICILIGSLVACESNQTAPSTASLTEASTPSTPTLKPAQKAIPYRTIAQDAPLGSHPADPLYTIVTSLQGWEALKDRLPPPALQAGQHAFQGGDELLVVAFAGAMGSSGYKITIEGISQESGGVIVQLRMEKPDPETIVEPAMTLPYHLISLNWQDIVKRQPLSFTFLDQDGVILNQIETSPP